MSEPKNFLSRWSRHKVAGAEQKSEAPVVPMQSSGSDEAADHVEKTSDASKEHQSESAEPQFDLKSLPSIETIQAGTDVSGFLKVGVPADLARAALRRAWVTDPNIRDFIGLSENSWDFTAPGAIPGFGPLSAEEASQLMARYAGKLHEVVNSGAEKVQEVATRLDRAIQAASEEVEHLPEPPAGIGSSDNLLHCDISNAASQNIADDEPAESLPKRRSHGSALPE